MPITFSCFVFQLETLTHHVQKWKELSDKFNKKLVSSEEEMKIRVSLQEFFWWLICFFSLEHEVYILIELAMCAGSLVGQQVYVF